MRNTLLKLKRHLPLIQLRNIRPQLVPVITFAVLLVLAAVTVWVVNRKSPPISRDSKVVIISHDHAQQTVPTIEPTVGALLKKLNLTLNQGDVVEPALTTKINQDDFRINIYRAVPVEVIDGNQKTFTFSAATTPRAIANQVGAKLYPEDKATTQPTANFLSQMAIGEQVVIDRATPVNLNFYGAAEVVRTHATTVGQLLSDKGIKLSKDDQLIPGANTPIVANEQIFIDRTGTKLETATETIPMPVQTVLDSSLAYGTSAIRQAGSNGEKLVTYQDNLKNGVVVGKTEIQSIVITPPVTQIVAEGTSLSGIKGDMALAGIAPGDYNYADYIISHESAWCPTKAQGEHYCPPVPDNQYTTAGYGLCQATPGTKMESFGSDWATNPITQLKWCNNYAVTRYGSWYEAYRHWINYRWW